MRGAARPRRRGRSGEPVQRAVPIDDVRPRSAMLYSRLMTKGLVDRLNHWAKSIDGDTRDGLQPVHRRRDRPRGRRHRRARDRPEGERRPLPRAEGDASRTSIGSATALRRASSTTPSTRATSPGASSGAPRSATSTRASSSARKPCVGRIRPGSMPDRVRLTVPSEERSLALVGAVTPQYGDGLGVPAAESEPSRPGRGARAVHARARVPRRRRRSHRADARPRRPADSGGRPRLGSATQVGGRRYRAPCPGAAGDRRGRGRPSADQPGRGRKAPDSHETRVAVVHAEPESHDFDSP